MGPPGLLEGGGPTESTLQDPSSFCPNLLKMTLEIFRKRIVWQLGREKISRQATHAEEHRAFIT